MSIEEIITSLTALQVYFEHFFNINLRHRHLEAKWLSNKGLLKAQEARDTVGERVVSSVPAFGSLEPSKDASDWNDLVRLNGKDAELEQIGSVELSG